MSDAASGNSILLFRLAIFVLKKRPQRTKMATIFDEFHLNAMVLETCKRTKIRYVSQRLDIHMHGDGNIQDSKVNTRGSFAIDIK